MTTADPYQMEEADAQANDGLGRWLQRLVTLIFLGLGVFVAAKALQLPYYTRVGPGPAFFPFWLGVALVALAVLALITSVRVTSERFEERIVPSGSAAFQMAVTFAMIGFFALTIQPLGFVISIFSVLLVLQLVNRVQPFTALLIAVGVSLGVGFAFANWLRVYLPVAPNGWLSALGL